MLLLCLLVGRPEWPMESLLALPWRRILESISLSSRWHLHKLMVWYCSYMVNVVSEFLVFFFFFAMASLLMILFV